MQLKENQKTLKDLQVDKEKLSEQWVILTNDKHNLEENVMTLSDSKIKNDKQFLFQKH